MTRIPLTRIATFAPFPHFLRREGFEVDRLLTSIGVDPELLTDNECLIPLALGASFVEAVVKKTGMAQIGLDVGSITSIHDLGAFGVVLSQSLTLRDLLQRLTRLMPAINSGAKTWIEDDSSAEVIVLRHQHQQIVQRANIDGYTLALLITAVRMAAGPQWRPKKIWLDAAAGRVDRFEALSDAQCMGDTHQIGFEIPRNLLSTPLLKSSHHQSTLNSPPQHHLNIIRDTAPAQDFIGNITQTIHSGLGSQVPSIEQTADFASTSVRTLQRKLKAKGWHYRELVDKVRHQETIRLLSSGETSILEISHHLGYTDPANFSHACQRWTGISPVEYRKQLQTERDS